MFFLVWVDRGFFRFVGPRIFPGDGELVAIVNHFDGSEGSVRTFCDVVETAGNLSVLHEHSGTVRVFVLDSEVVIDTASIFSFSDFGAGNAHGADRVCVFDPVDDVDIVEPHVDVDISALPSEVELIVELVLEFVPLWAAGEHGARGAHVPEGAGVVDFPDGTVVDAFDGFEVAELVSALESDADLQILFLGLFCGGKDAADADCVERDRFFHEDVFPLFDSFLKHHRSEGAGGGEDDDIAGGDGLFVAFETEEDSFFWNIHAGAVLDGETLERFLDFFVEELGDGDQFDVGAGFEGLIGGASGASTAAHHGEFERCILFCGVGESFDGQCG